jgi:hypothetical protein
MDDLVKRLQSLPPGKWALHEMCLCQELCMSAKEGLCVRKQLGLLLAALEKGSWGQKRDKTWTSTGLPMMDLGDTGIPNTIGIHYIIQGEVELFPTESLSEKSGSLCKPRYFMIDGLKGGPNDHHIKSQSYLIAKLVTGHQATRGLDEESRKRRQANWLQWYQEDDSHGKFTEFQQKDLPLIAAEFRDVWDVVLPKNQSRIQPRMLTAIGNEIRAVLQSCNQIPKKILKKTREDGVPLRVLSNNKRQQPQVETTTSTKKRCITPTVTTPTVTTLTVFTPTVTTLVTFGLPPQLTLNYLREAICDELAAIEYAVHLLLAKKLSIEKAADSFQRAGTHKPVAISLDQIHKLQKSLHKSALRNVSTARQELLNRLPGGHFRPKESDMLFEWMTDGKRYTDGERLPAVNYEIHPQSNRL